MKVGEIMFGFIGGFFEIMFVLVFAMVIGTFIFTFVKIFTTWNKNNKAPRLSVTCCVVGKRAHDSRRRHDNHTHYSTTYYVTFEFESTDRLELQVTGTEYGLLYEGDQGILTFQGTRYLGFDRK